MTIGCLAPRIAVLVFSIAGVLTAQTVTFDFDTAAPSLSTGQNIPLDQTVGGITAHFSSPSGSVFSVQSDSSTGWRMSLFSGNYLYDNNLDRNTLQIRFSQSLTAISMTFATADFHQIEVPTTIQLTAFLDSNTATPVGTATAHGTYATDTMPMGTLSFSSGGRPFNLVEIVLPYQPLGSTDFFVDNITVTPAPQTAALRFVPIAPCRVVDTRLPVGPLGGPALDPGQRDFPVNSGQCGIPASALAYSLNVTAVPFGALGYVSIWPAGQSLPVVSTLNSLDGRIKANAAIVPAGQAGAISVYASAPTHVVLDVNGYFLPAADPAGLAFYPVAPCRVFDTRLAAGALGGPGLGGGENRSFPVVAGGCVIPASARAYSLNFTAVPAGPLGYLTTWPSGSAMPVVSTLNAPTGTVTANAAIVPAGTNGAISVFASAPTDVIADINGYFAPPGTGGWSFYPVSPCRVADTRAPAGPLGGPMPFGQRDLPVPASACGLPGTAKAYSFNVTVVPPGPLGYLTIWPAGQAMPVVSTLNSLDGTIVANAAIVPTSNGSISMYVSAGSDVVLDTNGYFAP